MTKNKQTWGSGAKCLWGGRGGVREGGLFDWGFERVPSLQPNLGWKAAEPAERLQIHDNLL